MIHYLSYSTFISHLLHLCKGVVVLKMLFTKARELMEKDYRLQQQVDSLQQEKNSVKTKSKFSSLFFRRKTKK